MTTGDFAFLDYKILTEHGDSQRPVSLSAEFSQADRSQARSESGKNIGNTTAETHLPPVEIVETKAAESPAVRQVIPAVDSSAELEAEAQSLTPNYPNPYSRSMQERVAELQQSAPQGFNSTGEGTAAINALLADEKLHPDSEFVSGDGRLSSHATMRNSEGVLQEGIEAGERRSTSAIQLLFFTINSSERLDHPGYALDIARQVRMDRDCFRVLELAEKVQEPTLRRALQLSAYEEYMERVGGSYYNIALRDVANLNLGPMTREELAQRDRERKIRLAEQQQDLSTPRPGLTEAEQQELAQVLPHIASSREFWENVRRSKFDW